MRNTKSGNVKPGPSARFSRRKGGTCHREDRPGFTNGGCESMRMLNAVSALALLGVVCTATAANAVVLVVGGGAGSQCYATAEYGDPYKAFDICSRALSD